MDQIFARPSQPILDVAEICEVDLVSVQHFDAVIKFAVLVFHLRYEEQLKERESQLQKEDLSDMVAEHAAKQKVSDPILFHSF